MVQPGDLRSHSPAEATDPAGPTGALCHWLAGTSLDDIPSAVRERAKYLALDGIGCLLVGSHLPWSRLGVQAITEFDDGGNYLLAAWGPRTTSAYSAAMLNSSFIQAFELDDYYPAAPVHSNAILIPAMLPVLQKHPDITGGELLRALVLGYEVGPRIGLALHGPQMLSRGWHSGVVFGCAAAAAAAGSLLKLSAAQMEDAIGIANTQACGLMSAQFESMIKRMQHGFAARAGLYAAVLAERGYVGIKRSLEREYGGFLSVFGEGHTPNASEVTSELGTRWTTMEIAVKPYAAMGGIHAGIDAALALRGLRKIQPEQVDSILVEVGEAAFAHGGFEIHQPIEPITAQMSLKYCIAVTLLDGAALLAQFSQHRINSGDVWDLASKVEVKWSREFDRPPHTTYTTRVTIRFRDGDIRQQTIETPTGGTDRPLANDAVAAKFQRLTSSVADPDRCARIGEFILTLDKQEKALDLIDLLRGRVKEALS